MRKKNHHAGNIPRRIPPGERQSDETNDKADSFITQLDDLKHLCSESLRSERFSPHEENTSKSPESHQPLTCRFELGELILRCLDGNISSEDFSLLQRWITEDPDAMQSYLDYVCLSACLYCLRKKAIIPEKALH